jgi:peptidoglycan/xylan/chitin deacetylase (PgdA/CDA1 family)
MNTTTLPSSAPTTESEGRWSPSPLIRAVFVLHALAAAMLIVEPELWASILGALAFAHGTMALLGMVPRNAWLGPNLTRLPADSVARGEVALTFDDGPDPALTPRILDILDAYGAKASFFCVGERVEAEPALAREILRRGHSLENHTQTHPQTFAFLFVGGLSRQILAAHQAIVAAGGRPAFFRAPMGLRNPVLDWVMHRTGYRYLSWTRRGLDTIDGSADAVLRRLTAGLRAGDVLLLHDSGPARTKNGEPVVLEVLPRLLAELEARNLRAVPLPTAFESAPRTDEPEAAPDRSENETGVHAEQQHVVA